MMKKMITCLLATLGFTSACGQQNFENSDVNGFCQLIEETGTVILDVRTAAEYHEGHIEGAINIDQGQGDFMEKAKSVLPIDKKIAVYCRSGRRSANAAARLATEGYQCVNLKGGIIAWKEANKPVTTDSYEMDIFKTKSGKTVKFHALVHASIRIEYDGKEIEIDPVTKLGNRTIDFTAMPKANYIFVTHEHGDHFDKEALKVLSDDGTRLVTNKRCADMYGSGEVMANGDVLKIANDFTVEAVPAYNITEGRLQFHPKGRDNGYILTLDGLRIYIAGDTEDIPEMEAVKDIDIAFLPCNQPYTMTTDQLVKAAKTIKPKVLFPYHYGQTDVSTISSQLQGTGIDVRIRHYE
jgi:L-ascorbate metabolism protein UlaG (beta-lactamase superfamily)/rhodanese-related sulfurtransferase